MRRRACEIKGFPGNSKAKLSNFTKFPANLKQTWKSKTFKGVKQMATRKHKIDSNAKGNLPRKTSLTTEIEENKGSDTK